jgi:prepilin-type N-terminal cleavage/methylation domain-containing protein
MQYKKQTGFTILELMIAMTVFTVAILLVTTGVIQIGREYRLGATKAKINSFTRDLHSQFTQQIQYSGTSPVILTSITTPTVPAGYVQAICIGTTRYLIKDVDQTNPYGDQSLAIDDITDPSNCNKPVGLVVWPLPKEARITDFRITKPYPSVSYSYKLYTRIVIGQKDMFEGSTPPADDGDFTKSCKSNGGFGSAFCSVIILSSDIARKVNNN